MSPLEALENANENHVKNQLINAYEKLLDRYTSRLLALTGVGSASVGRTTVGSGIIGTSWFSP